MAQETYRKCANCGHLNLNRDYCEQCGALININLRRKLKREKQAETKEEEKQLEKPNVVSQYLKEKREHPNWFVRLPAKALYSVWVVVLAIGAFLAFIFSYFAV